MVIYTDEFAKAKLEMMPPQIKVIAQNKNGDVIVSRIEKLIKNNSNDGWWTEAFGDCYIDVIFRAIESPEGWENSVITREDL